MEEKNIEIAVIESKELSTIANRRFVVVEYGTGKILDDANGCGYKTVKGALKSWKYRHGMWTIDRTPKYIGGFYEESD